MKSEIIDHLVELWSKDPALSGVPYRRMASQAAEVLELYSNETANHRGKTWEEEFRCTLDSLEFLYKDCCHQQLSYDFIIGLKDIFHNSQKQARIQCKLTSFGDIRSSKKKPYLVDEFDILALKTGQGNIFLIPATELVNPKTGTIFSHVNLAHFQQYKDNWAVLDDCKTVSKPKSKFN